MIPCETFTRPESITVNPNGTFSKVIVLGGETVSRTEDSSAPAKGLPAEGDSCSLPKEITLERDACAEIVIIVLPGADCRLPLKVRLTGEGAQANISGIFITGADEKVNIAVDVFHDVPRCNSRQLFKGIAGGNSKVDFYGKIVVAQDAQKTEAYQENHNGLLSDDARVNTKPQLEIYADDVK